jgi:RimJ/RimL family protein N-acetyltransferase
MAELTLRFLAPTDLDELHGLVSDWEVVRQLGSWPWPADRKFTASRCRPYGGRGFVWGIFDGAHLVGTMGVTEGELGYGLRPQYWGRGIATRVAGEAIDHGFRDPALLAIKAEAWADNGASLRVLEKLGFRPSAQTIEFALARQEMTESRSFQLSRKDWHALRRAQQ